jgi:hypothetical protein
MPTIASAELQNCEQTNSIASIFLTVQKWFWAVLAVEVLVIVLFEIPTRLGFDGTAFGDCGLSLTAQSLIQQGYKPGLDFGYPYGTLSLLFGRLWFGLFGLTPHAFFSATVLCDLVFALGLARFANQLRLRSCAALGLIAVSLPFCILANITFAHVLERVFLVWALTVHAGGRRSHALALSTAAALAKPSMGFVYGFLLLVFIVQVLWKESKLTPYFLAREVRSAAVTAVGVLAVSIAVYGAPVTLRLLLPLTGAEVYRANNLGFFSGVGRAFWYFPGVHAGYYFGTPITFWLFASVWLIAGGCSVALTLLENFKNREEVTPARELTVFCALMHVAFVVLFFGSNASWTSYAYLLPMGVAAMTLWSKYSMKFIWLLIALGVAGQKGMIVENFQAWLNTAPSSTTAGLWANPDERKEWKHVLGLAEGNSSVVLASDGFAQMMFTQLSRPVVVQLYRGQSTASELKRQIGRLSTAQIAIVPEVPNSSAFLNQWPEFKDALSKLRMIVFKGRYFTVYRRS